MESAVSQSASASNVSRGAIGGQFRGELGATFPEVVSRNSQRPKGLGAAAVSSH